MHIQTSVTGAVGTITIDRKSRFNSLDVETARDLRRAGLQMARERAVRCVVLRGLPGVFCSGADLKYIRAGGTNDDVSYLRGEVLEGGYGAIFKEILEYLHSTISEIRRASKPFVAAVDGIAAAGGFGLAMACDLVFASERASFEWAYARTGLSGAESSTFMIPRLVGLRRALGLLLLNPRIDPAKALELGLINEVFPAESFDETVAARAAEIAAGPTWAYGAAKDLMNQSSGMGGLDHHLDRELEQLVRSANSVDFAEGIDAFFEKRAPAFTGDGSPAGSSKKA